MLHTSLFLQMILGHFVGDFLFQPKWMAQRKGEPGWHGATICFLHVALYTLAIAVFAGLWKPWFLLAVAVPHFIVDRKSLALRYLRALNGRTPENVDPDDLWDAPFTAIVYTITDATIHMMFLYGALKML